MRKMLAMSTLFAFSLLLVGCGNNNETTPTSTPENICDVHKGTLVNWAEGGDITVCAFDDDSFCFIEDLESGICEKGFIYFEDDEGSEIENLDNDVDTENLDDNVEKENENPNTEE